MVQTSSVVRDGAAWQLTASCGTQEGRFDRDFRPKQSSPSQDVPNHRRLGEPVLHLRGKKSVSTLQHESRLLVAMHPLCFLASTLHLSDKFGSGLAWYGAVLLDSSDQLTSRPELSSSQRAGPRAKRGKRTAVP